MRNIFTAIFISVLIIGVYNCGGNNKKAENENGAKKETAADTTTVAKKKCPGKTAVKVESKNGAYPKGPMDWSDIKSSAAYMPLAMLGGDSKALIVFISNADITFDMMKAGTKTALQPGQAFLRLSFTNGQQNAGAGVYKPDPDYAASMRFDADIHIEGKTAIQFNSYKSEGEAEIISIENGKACGRFKLKDPWSDISGEFNVPLIK